MDGHLCVPGQVWYTDQMETYPDTPAEGGVATLAPPINLPVLDGSHDRMTHIVLEGLRNKETDEFYTVQAGLMESMINGVPVTALCGKTWVPEYGGAKFPKCPTCVEIAKGNGWNA